MSHTIIFNKTNRIGDDYEETADAVARAFWASEDAQTWLAKPGGPLERLALSWVAENFGNWDCRDDWGPICDAILAAMPREKSK